MELQIFVRFCQSLEKRGSTALVILQLLELLEVAVHCSTSRFFDQQKQMAGHQVFEDDGVVVVVVCLSFFFLSFVSCFKGSQQLALILPRNVKWPSSRDAKKNAESVGLLGIVQTEETEALVEPAL